MQINKFDFKNWLDNKVKDKKVLEIRGLGDVKACKKNNFINWIHKNLENYISNDSELIIITSNPFAFKNIVRVLLGKKPKTNENHIVWFNENNIFKLAKRFKFYKKELHYFDWNTSLIIKQKIVSFAGIFNKYFHQSLAIFLH